METLILIILALLFPPAAVFVKQDFDLDKHVLVNVIFTFLGCWIGGVLHALYVIFKE